MQIVSRFFMKLAHSLGIPQMQQRLDETQVGLYSYMDEANLRLNQLEFDVRDVASSSSDALALARDAEAVAQFVESRANTIATLFGQRVQDDLARHIYQDHNKLNQEIDVLRTTLEGTESRLQAAMSKAYRAIDAVHHDTTIDDSLYVSLEDQFRGAREVIAERQSDYLRFLSATISNDHPLLDLGCGRGEWLRLLASQQIPARGVDSNAVCVQECVDAGLNVLHEDLYQHLKGLEDSTVGAVTLFQVLEHLPFDEQVEVMRHIRRVLVPGGVMIVEIPNSKNLRVGASTFWIDPTHLRPLFPDVLIFLATQVGFQSVSGHYSNRLGPVHDYSSLPQSLRGAVENVMESLDGPGDFALVAVS